MYDINGLQGSILAQGMSINEVLPGLGNSSLVEKSRKEVVTLDELAKPGGVQFGLRAAALFRRRIRM